MNLMSPTTVNHGVLLTRFLEKEWDALGTTRGSWCRRAGIPDSTVYRWSQGVQPDLDNMVALAEALGRRLTDVLYHAGYIGEDEMRVRTVAPANERPALEDMIRTDDALSPPERQALLAVHAAFTRPVAKGAKRSVRVTSRG